jgi:transcriptional regulator with XRE-family HTH domain
MKTKAAEKLTDQLRRIVTDSGKTLGQITRDTGIDKSALSRFLSGERGVSAHVLDQLGDYFSLRIVADEPKAKKGR